MKYRRLGKTELQISEISLGTWQVGGKWGTGFDHDNADKILHQAIDEGINFIDTADVYENGESEIAVGRVVNQRSEEIYIATKCGRHIVPQVNEGYTPQVLRSYVEDSLKRLNRDWIDLIQLHCPPTEVFYRPEIFGLFERLKEEGKIRNLGVSVEKVEQALKAIEYSHVASVQIIYNMFRQRPADYFFDLAAAKDVGLIIRVPLASGLLTGAYSKDTSFSEGDHRHGNRDGEWFDRGETFAGVPYDIGLEAVRQIKALFPACKNLAPIALQWILQSNEVSCIIPGVSRAEQLVSNLSYAEMDSISSSQLAELDQIYETLIKPHVHHYW